MQKVNDPAVRHTSSGALIRRFLPYLAKYKKTLFIDLFCAAMTTLCDIILPKIMSTITNSAMGVGITLTAGIVLKLAAVYFVLRIIDGAAQYFMSGIGHIMGVHIETDMRRDAFDHLLKLDHTYYNNTKVGTIMGRITNDLFDVTEFAHHCPEEFFIAGIKILASFLILCQASVPLTLAVFACVPLMGVVSVKLNQRFERSDVVLPQYVVEPEVCPGQNGLQSGRTAGLHTDHGSYVRSGLRTDLSLCQWYTRLFYLQNSGPENH